MHIKFPLKITFALLAALVILIILDIFLLQGGFGLYAVAKTRGQRDTEQINTKQMTVEQIGAKGQKSSYQLTQEKNKENLVAESLTIVSKSDDGVFRAGSKIEITCVLKNDSDAVLRNFRSLVRTPYEEITSVYTKTLAAGETLTLNGSFVPQNSGITVVACRGDADKETDEADETDNREIRILYISQPHNRHISGV